jgi:transcriptional regulator with XRE-family HTH domain
VQNEQSAKSVARKQRGGKGDEGLSPEEQAVKLRGQEYRRYIVAAAALRDIYTVGDLARAVGVSEGTVQGWYRGAQPKAETLPKIARATGFRTDALFAWVYGGGGPPPLPDPAEEAEAQARAARAGSGAPASGERRAPHEKAGSGR